VIPFAKDEVSPPRGSGDRKTDALEHLAAAQVLVWLANEASRVSSKFSQCPHTSPPVVAGTLICLDRSGPPRTYLDVELPTFPAPDDLHRPIENLPITRVAMTGRRLDSARPAPLQLFQTPEGRSTSARSRWI
jgi:hypothetical protein